MTTIFLRSKKKILINYLETEIKAFPAAKSFLDKVKPNDFAITLFFDFD